MIKFDSNPDSLLSSRRYKGHISTVRLAGIQSRGGRKRESGEKPLRRRHCNRGATRLSHCPNKSSLSVRGLGWEGAEWATIREPGDLPMLI